MPIADCERPAHVTGLAVRKCADLLATCINLGWARKDLDFLERAWWKYHDRHGNLTKGRADGAPPGVNAT